MSSMVISEEGRGCYGNMDDIIVVHMQWVVTGIALWSVIQLGTSRD